jgi:hypothetical protein
MARSVSPDGPRRTGRRSFLSHMIRTAAVGVGLAAVGGPAAMSARPGRANAAPATAQCLGFSCTPVDPNSCGCPGGQYGNYFRCYDPCTGQTSYSCQARPCSSWCSNAC